MPDLPRQVRIRQPSAAEIVAIWERAVQLSPADRGLAMMSFVRPDKSWSELAEMPLGVRDQTLLELRRVMFGPTIRGFAVCPRCAEKLEFHFAPPEFPQPAADGRSVTRTFADADFTIEYRAPTTADLRAAAGISDATEIRNLLLSRCVFEAHENGSTTLLEQLPSEVLERLEERLSEENVATDLRLNLRCAKCGTPWEAALEIAAFLWTEWETQARNLLFDVVSLARAYGWNESEILAMGVARRRFYLELVPT